MLKKLHGMIYTFIIYILVPAFFLNNTYLCYYLKIFWSHFVNVKIMIIGNFKSKVLIITLVISQVFGASSYANQCLKLFEREGRRAEINSGKFIENLEKVEKNIQQLKSSIPLIDIPKVIERKSESYKGKISNAMIKIETYLGKIKKNGKVKKVDLVRVEAVLIALELANKFSNRNSKKEMDKAMDLFVVLLTTKFLKKRILKNKDLEFIEVYISFLTHISDIFISKPERATLGIIFKAINDFTSASPIVREGERFSHEKIHSIDIEYCVNNHRRRLRSTTPYTARNDLAGFRGLRLHVTRAPCILS